MELSVPVPQQMGRQAVKLNKKAEAAEVAELSERVLSEAPARGANPLLTESDEVAMLAGLG